jgi:putative chitinase
MDMNLDQFIDIIPLADDNWFLAVLGMCDLDPWGINTRLRIAGFLGQTCYESTQFTDFEENLSYSPQDLMRVWPNRFPTLDKTTGYAYNPPALAYLVYGNRMGNSSSGDGYLYHGRGPIQITGRAEYGLCGRALALDLLSSPELLLQTAPGASSAAWFWSAHGCNELADAQDWQGVTRRINGGLDGLALRTSWISKFLECVGGP